MAVCAKCGNPDATVHITMIKAGKEALRIMRELRGKASPGEGDR